jgi:hypothetical protein
MWLRKLRQSSGRAKQADIAAEAIAVAEAPARTGLATDEVHQMLSDSVFGNIDQQFDLAEVRLRRGDKPAAVLADLRAIVEMLRRIANGTARPPPPRRRPSRSGESDGEREAAHMDSPHLELIQARVQALCGRHPCIPGSTGREGKRTAFSRNGVSDL